MAFETFDLGRAYSDAARIKALEAETADRSRRTDLYERSLNQKTEPTVDDAIKNLRVVRGAAGIVAQNPERAMEIVDSLKRQGVLSPDFVLPPGLTPEQVAAEAQRMIAEADGILAQFDKPEEVKPPPVRTVTKGDEEVQQEFDPKTNTWREIGRGRRWAPQSASEVGPAPSLTEVVDPADPNRLLRVDARTYKGGSLGAPGVFGISGKEPSAAKREEQRGTSRQAVDELVATLSDQFSQLNEGGGITNTDSGIVENITAGVASSGAGQSAGKLLGTKNQSLRNQIQQTRPRLLSAIMAATGMSARQLDSNAELKLWLSAATDPTLDYQANMAALNNILKLYGSEGSLSGASGAPAANSDKNGDGVVDWKDLEK